MEITKSRNLASFSGLWIETLLYYAGLNTIDRGFNLTIDISFEVYVTYRILPQESGN